MALENLDLAGLANIAVRTLHHEIRQATSSAISSAISSATPSPDPTLASSSTVFASSTDPFEGPTSTPQVDNGGNNNRNGQGSGNSSGQGSSPLLFFVALGFGVVFTNLWIIVGVKYCFRYNARNRNIRMTGEDGEPINLENMPQHPRRRRREKKLMTMDEVNEKFPMMKYKSWVASRAQEGLPTRGGISQPPSRANSIRDPDGIIPTIKERESTDGRPVTSGTSIIRETTREPTTEHTEKATPTTTADVEAQATNPGTTNATTAPARTGSPTSDDDDDDHYEDEDDQIHDALPPDALESSGDTCAICIDTLEDDDDIRGLTCGHAFHAVCLDPWLTSRRACCPLCKADYYTPKPRQPQPEGVEGTQVGPTVSIAQDPRTSRANMPSRPGVAWIFSGRRGRMGLPGRNRENGSNQPQLQSRSNNNGRRQRQQQPPQQRTGFFSRSSTQPSSRPAPAAADNSTSQTTEARSGGFLSSIRQNLPSFGRSNAPQEQSAANAQVTPSALEAGTRADAAR
ncbi:hypothetical protein DHEL01_v201142 [Diaporthe helianthi]|uniref:RING-type domain-containing protein n=1 Tax=Diaporthe helianthi TaxID=158607 RepID=A0A2P5ID90_DIAHE|nr:hypothetical protein DHEL01_v201142 [Diaporthe helianthi]